MVPNLAQPVESDQVIESFRDFMNAVLTRGYRFKAHMIQRRKKPRKQQPVLPRPQDKIFRNDMMVLLMYISKRVENRTLFASTGCAPRSAAN